MKSVVLAIPLLLMASACSDGDDIDSDTEARWAYLGFDSSIEVGLNLGFDGFNAATSANIDTQSATGSVAGELLVDGQVDQGNSANKGMRLLVTLTEYDNGTFLDESEEDPFPRTVVYDTPDEAPLMLTLQLRNFPDGGVTGTLVGAANVTGAVDGIANFNLSLSGDTQAGDADGEVVRVPGTLEITGTVTSGDGAYNVDVTR